MILQVALYSSTDGFRAGGADGRPVYAGALSQVCVSRRLIPLSSTSSDQFASSVRPHEMMLPRRAFATARHHRLLMTVDN